MGENVQAKAHSPLFYAHAGIVSRLSRHCHAFFTLVRVAIHRKMSIFAIKSITAP